MRVRSKVWLEKDGKLVLGSGRLMILREILKTGSVNKAARVLNMSYRHAWSYIKTAEKRLGRRLVISKKGGVKGGGTQLTGYALRLIDKFARLERRVRLSTDRFYRQVFL
jgi:molybdate transport system regulatory protein